MDWIDQLVAKHLEDQEDAAVGFTQAYLEIQDIFYQRHEDVDAWYAPSECHGDVSRGNNRDEEHFWGLVEKAGVSQDAVEAEYNRIMNDDNPF